MTEKNTHPENFLLVAQNGEGGLTSPRGFGNSVNAALVYLSELTSATSRRTMASKLNKFSQWAGYKDLYQCEWAKLRPEHVLAFFMVQEKMGIAPSTSNCYLAAIKGVARAAWMAGDMPHEIFLKIKNIKQKRYYRLPRGRAIGFDESKKLMDACSGDSPQDIRDKAILALMLGCGLRRGEIPYLRLENYDPIEKSLRLIGKGNKERKVFLPPPVVTALNAWILKFRPEDKGLIFCRFYKGGHLNTENPIDPTSIGRITKARMLEANNEACSAHDLRRTFATRLLDRHVDIVTVKNMMGHANIATTALYDRRGEEEQQKVAQLSIL